MTEFGDGRLPERFWQKVRIAESGCWLWMAASNESGYGKVVAPSRPKRSVRAHRLAYETLVGPCGNAPLDHLCHNRDESCPGGRTCVHRRCVNPSHLEPSTTKQNNRNGKGLAGVRSRQTHCLRGHEFTVENTRINSRGSRICRSCVRNAKRGLCRKMACGNGKSHRRTSLCTPKGLGRPAIEALLLPLRSDTPREAAA